MDSLRAGLAALLIALVAALIVVLPALDTLRGVSIARSIRPITSTAPSTSSATTALAPSEISALVSRR